MSAIVRCPWTFACGAEVFLGLCENRRVGLSDHLLAKINSDQVILKQVVVEHVLGRFAEVDNPFRKVRRANTERHVLSVDGTSCVVVPADSTNATRDEVSVARVLALHEDAVAAEDGRRALALDHTSVREVDLGVNAETADDPCYRDSQFISRISGGLVALTQAAARFGSVSASLALCSSNSA